MPILCGFKGLSESSSPLYEYFHWTLSIVWKEGVMIVIADLTEGGADFTFIWNSV
jgi:hypothetical protein